MSGPFLGSMFMIIVDAHSKLLEVFLMKNITTTETLKILRKLFATYGLPHQLITTMASNLFLQNLKCV